MNTKPKDIKLYTCSDCLYEEKSSTDWPCRDCSRRPDAIDHYIHKNQKPKTCIWCAHLDKHMDEEPCCHCDEKTNSAYERWRGGG